MANLPPEMASEIGKARAAGGGNYIQHGDYVFVIDDWKYQKVQDRCIVLDLVPAESKKKVVMEGDKRVEQEPNPVGSVCGEIANFDGDGKLSAPGNARKPVLALFGFEEGQVKDDIVTGTLDECIGPGKPANGMMLGCSTYAHEIKSRKGNYITGRNWIHLSKPGTGINRADLVAARLAAKRAGGNEAMAKLAAEHLAAWRAEGGNGTVNSTSSGFNGTANSTNTQAPAPPAPPPPTQAAPPPPVDPLAGWTVNPNDSDWYYRFVDGKPEQKLKTDLLAGR